jgi:four helix bundle protein
MEYMKSYRDLIAWQKARKLNADIYLLTREFPSDERFGLVSQMRRAAVSIMSNLAEGFRRGHQAEWRQFVRQAYGSASEIECQLTIASDVGFIRDDTRYHSCTVLTEEVLRLLGGLTRALERPSDLTAKR